MSRSKRQRPRLHPRLLPHPVARPPAVALAESYTWAWNVTFRVSSAVSTVLWASIPTLGRWGCCSRASPLHSESIPDVTGFYTCRLPMPPLSSDVPRECLRIVPWIRATLTSDLLAVPLTSRACFRRRLRVCCKCSTPGRTHGSCSHFLLCRNVRDALPEERTSDSSLPSLVSLPCFTSV